MKTFLIGTRLITQPNMIGEVISETPKTITLRVVELVFTPKSSIRWTHKFTKGERQWFQGLKGQTRKFWRESGVEVGGTSKLVEV